MKNSFRFILSLCDVAGNHHDPMGVRDRDCRKRLAQRRHQRLISEHNPGVVLALM
jgi:hypothetical protein